MLKDVKASRLLTMHLQKHPLKILLEPTLQSSHARWETREKNRVGRIANKGINSQSHLAAVLSYLAPWCQVILLEHLPIIFPTPSLTLSTTNHPKPNPIHTIPYHTIPYHTSIGDPEKHDTPIQTERPLTYLQPTNQIRSLFSTEGCFIDPLFRVGIKPKCYILSLIPLTVGYLFCFVRFLRVNGAGRASFAKRSKRHRNENDKIVRLYDG